ncbi:DNA alkylation repair protein [Paenibacillus selenitireducens]|uniref:DNA alkylation repair protein n=1 Tax=Paenibacillus selenitireducens TaxID=1324314 RepID=A0A1T2X327_9BACL|nr:DNA alkylation repair protein [Paenibacillus selenitireducens]OPA74301.1 DNA alkylation repair protein [Paenibacillus selenitireducens]
MLTYAQQLEAYFRTHANAEQAAPMAAYMRDQFPFLGIRSTERTQLLRSFFQEYGIPKENELAAVSADIWNLPEREFQYIAMVVLEKYRKKAPLQHIEALEQYVVSKSWWDTVDLISSRLIGFHLMQYPELIPTYTEHWIASDNFWLQRAALLYQLSYKKNTDVERLFRYIEHCKEDKEFFIRKAIGWVLREYSKTDEAAVRQFVANTSLSPLSVKEALKYVDRSMP